MCHDNLDYFRQRALAERELAKTAGNKAVAAVHEDMAQRYEELADAEQRRLAPIRAVA